MKVAIVYVYPPNAGMKYNAYTERFLHCYHAFPPGMDHQSVVVLNGAQPTTEITCIFSSLPNVRFISHDNSGYDIGAFQHAAREVECDMMVFFGSSTYFHWPGWLIRMAGSFIVHGNAQYGAMGNRGNRAVGVWPHIRTTAFWMDPKLMNAYPKIVSKPQERHPFEHGRECFTEWVKRQGLKSWVVTRTRELLWEDWDSDPEGYARGNQRDMIAGDRMCERPYFKGNRCRQFPDLPCSPWQTENCWPCMMKTA